MLCVSFEMRKNAAHKSKSQYFIVIMWAEYVKNKNLSGFSPLLYKLLPLKGRSLNQIIFRKKEAHPFYPVSHITGMRVEHLMQHTFFSSSFLHFHSILWNQPSISGSVGCSSLLKAVSKQFILKISHWEWSRCAVCRTTFREQATRKAKEKISIFPSWKRGWGWIKTLDKMGSIKHSFILNVKSFSTLFWL